MKLQKNNLHIFDHVSVNVLDYLQDTLRIKEW